MRFEKDSLYRMGTGCQSKIAVTESWDPDFTKVTADEAARIAAAEESGFVAEEEIDWNNLAKYTQ